MSRTVIDVHFGGQANSFVMWLSEPSHLQGASRWEPFPYSTTDPIPSAFVGGMGGVNDIGEYILNGLFNHPAVKSRLEALLDAGPDATEPVLLRISPEAENLPWETLFAKGTFLALDRRWPIARMSLEGERDGRTRDFQPPLKILAVLAADGVEATNEWRGMLASLGGAKFPVAVKALVAEQGLHDEIAATSTSVVSAEADFVPTELAAFTETIESYRPNVLHFFCHGYAEGGKSYLQIATMLSRRGAGSPLYVEAVNLPMATLGDALWLVTLNCCRSAQATEGSGSLGFSLVGSTAPVVAGMREPVSEPDANAFTRGFYRALIGLLAPAAKPGKQTQIDWTAALYEPRRELCEAHRGSNPCHVAALSIREWTLPVLYVRSGEFTLRGRRPPRAPKPPSAAGPGQRILGNAVRALRRAGPSLSEEDRAAIEIELQFVRDLLESNLGAPPQALEAYRSRIQDLETRLYGRK